MRPIAAVRQGKTDETCSNHTPEGIIQNLKGYDTKKASCQPPDVVLQLQPKAGKVLVTLPNTF